MSKHIHFREAGFLALLEKATGIPADFPVPVLSEGSNPRALNEAGQWLVQLLKAHEAETRAARDTEVAADELRRYQKFARPGQPTAHIVQLRQQQAAARQASARSRQAFLKAAMEFTRAASLTKSPRMTLDAFIHAWIDANVPKDRG
jgi:hypothetical protein